MPRKRVRRRKVAATLSERGINVDELSTECTSAPMSGGDLFRVSALIACPPGVALDDLRAALERVANDLMVDISLSETTLVSE